jgi:hypothetical protein
MINVLLREAVDGMLRLVAATDVAMITADDNVTKEFVSIAVSDETGYLVCRDPRLLSEYDSLLIDGFRLGRLDFSKYMFEGEEEEDEDDDDDSGIFS